MKRLLLALLLSMPSLVNGRQVLPWELLAVPYATTPDGLYEPQFPAWLDKYKNQEVILQGYLVPVDVEGNQ